MQTLLSRICWTITCMAIVLVSVEATVRLDDWAQHGVPLASGTTGLMELLVTDTTGTHARPSSEFRQFRINALGFRGPEVTPESMSRGTLIVTTGASETFGLYETRGKEWPRQLEDSLRHECPSAGWLLQNAAFAGMTIPAVVRDIERRIRPLLPEVLVYYPTPMQYLEDELPSRVPKTASAPRPRAPWWRIRAIARFRDATKRAVPEPVLDILRRVSTRRQRQSQALAVWTAPPADRLARYEEDLRWLAGVMRATGARPVLIVHQNRFRDTTSADSRRMLRAWERFYPRATGSSIVAFDDMAAQRTRAVAADSGVILVDPTPAVRRAGITLFADFSHFVDAGSAVVAGEASRGIVASTGCVLGR